LNELRFLFSCNLYMLILFYCRSLLLWGWLVVIQIEMSFFLRFEFLFRVEFVFGSYKVMILKFSAA
jgi:hypothetical protein